MADEAQAMAAVVLRARSDPAFRSRLTADPRGALAAEGVRVPEGIEVRVVESTDRVAYIALPPLAEGASDELGEEVLEGVAGGMSTACCWLCWL